MQINFLQNTKLAIIQSDKQLINDGQSALELLMNCSYGGADAVVLQQHHLAPSFFNLRSGLAGEVLQKVSNYRMKLAVLGDFDQVESESLRAFMLESNKRGEVLFLPKETEVTSIFNP